MNIENATKWAKALRSGEFEQTTHRMSSLDGGRFCCLGVACKIARLPVGEDTANYLHVARWLGLDHDVYKPWGTTYEYSGLNDRERKTFSEIADVIDQHINEAQTALKEAA